jgi:hypothetical protein
LDVAALCSWQPAEDIRQVFQRIDAATAATYKDRVDNGAAPAGIGVPYEQPTTTFMKSFS